MRLHPAEPRNWLLPGLTLHNRVRLDLSSATAPPVRGRFTGPSSEAQKKLPAYARFWNTRSKLAACSQLVADEWHVRVER